MKCPISPPARCSEHLRHHLPLLWWKLHAIGPQDLALSPRFLNMKQLPLQSCWSLHPHSNESFTSKKSCVCVCLCVEGKVWKSLICSLYPELKAHYVNSNYERETPEWCWWVLEQAFLRLPTLDFKITKCILVSAQETQMYVLSPC